MPALGDIERRLSNGSRQYIWHACLDCGKERWVGLTKGVPNSRRCYGCAASTPERKRQSGLGLRGDKTSKWKGGRQHTPQGYIKVYLKEDDFFFPMVSGRTRYVYEHRLVMAKHIGRNLHLWELVHHKNHIKDDNRIENLQLTSDMGHKQITLLETRIALLEKRVIILETDNILLRGQLSETHH